MLNLKLNKDLIFTEKIIHSSCRDVSLIKISQDINDI